jgi:SAM-dependent methyltransferase
MLIPPHLIPALAQDPDHPEQERYQTALWAAITRLTAQFYAPALRQMMATVGLRGDALDLACGSGTKSRLLLDAGVAHVTGIEIDADELAQTGPPDDRLNFRQGDVLRPLPFPPASFDVLYVGNPFLDLFPHLESARQMLKPGGVLLLETNNIIRPTLYAWDRGLQARVDAAYEQAINETDYAAGTRYEAAFYAACRRLDLQVAVASVSYRPPFPPPVVDYLSALFACHTAPLIRPHLPVDDFDRLLQLYTPASPAYLFQRADAHFVGTIVYAIIYY